MAHGNKQTGFWTKTAVDVIFSQNLAYDHAPSDSSPLGACMGFQYAPELVWFLFNEMHDCTTGLGSGSDAIAFGQRVFAIGNVIHDIHSATGFDPNAGGWGRADTNSNDFGLMGGNRWFCFEVFSALAFIRFESCIARCYDPFRGGTGLLAPAGPES
ncbi:MAG: hypothetical protein ACKVPX_12480 [Myxococcaceae bacterium]